MKYDCSKTLDYAHEYKRMCNSYIGANTCRPCPMAKMNCRYAESATKEHIDIVQKWSDEHPEKPKLTKEERAFIEAFFDKDKKYIECNTFKYGPWAFALRKDMFGFINDDEKWTFNELLELEVEE